VQSSKKTILDACCGSRMFWFDKKDSRVVFMDNRKEDHLIKDCSVPGGVRGLSIHPDVQSDFTNMPFPDKSFNMVVFDPPHFRRNGSKSWVGLKYGTLKGDWKNVIRGGFSECFRVLCDGGTLIFKWCDVEIKVSEILKLSDVVPVVGHKSGKNSNTHWLTFIKQ
jgi:hypothetical protein